MKLEAKLDEPVADFLFECLSEPQCTGESQ